MTQHSFNKKHRLESKQSWNRFQSITVTAQQRHKEEDYLDGTNAPDKLLGRENDNRRQLKHKKSHDDKKKRSKEADATEREKEDEYRTEYEMQLEHDERHYRKKLRKQQEQIDEMYADPLDITPINTRTVHGLMIDAGSTGSRMHIYEWEPRILYNTHDIQLAVSGDKLSYPGTESRWTDRLRPGIGSFDLSTLDDEQLHIAISEYLEPLLDFGKAVLDSKRQNFGQYPIFLRATAGMRTLSDTNRSRIMNTVRSLLSNTTFNPFYFVNEQARVLSGEEEAIYDWTGVNFLLGELLQDSLGSGTVVNPVRTHGALDLGGSSTQISFYEPNGDIMANLFKLQIGQAKHWNVYGHSFLYYGMNDAITRFQSRLAAEKTAEQRLITGIYNPCLPGGASVDIRTNIHLNSKGVETWDYFEQDFPSGNGYYQATLVNNNQRGNFNSCMNVTKDILHLNGNDFCNFAYKGDCSIDGTYQPKIPSNVDFVAFSNFYHIWQFLNLPERASINHLINATEHICSMSLNELQIYHTQSINPDVDDNDDIIGETMTDVELTSYCFRSVYVVQLLQNGYGFQLNDTIRSIDVINGQKVGWALGAMLYEINTMPWTYEEQSAQHVTSVVGVDTSSTAGTTGAWNVINSNNNHQLAHDWVIPFILSFSVIGTFLSLLSLFIIRERRLRNYQGYETVK